jgi:hypothetical protein
MDNAIEFSTTDTPNSCFKMRQYRNPLPMDGNTKEEVRHGAEEKAKKGTPIRLFHEQ